jgi:rhodanese-related sulfurtransferase
MVLRHPDVSDSRKKKSPLVLYCNGPYCGKSKRLAEELLAAGYTNVRRYQLGIPVWRALGGLTEIEPDGVRHAVANDRTAVLIDAREADVFRSGTLPMPEASRVAEYWREKTWVR